MPGPDSAEEVRLPGGGLVEALARRAEIAPAAPYLSALDATGQLTTRTFAEVWRMSLRAATALRRVPGVRPDALVAFAPDSTVESVATAFGALAVGAGVMVLEPAWSDRQRADIAAAHGAVLLDGKVDSTTGHTGATDAAADRTPEWHGDSSGCTSLVFNTSGSTGIPKAVALPHSALLANARSFRAHHRVEPGHTVLTCLPLHHSNAVNTCVISPLVTGAHSVLLPPTSLLDLPRWIAECEPTIVNAVPSVLDALHRIQRQSFPPSVRYALSAAAPLSNATAARFAERFGLRIVQAYGLSETVNFSTTMPVDLSERAYRELVVDAPVPSVGVALDGVDIALRDPDGRMHRDEDRVGEVCISGPALMSGYLGDAEQTAEVLSGGIFRTGDLGVLRTHPEAGTLLYLTGRSKNIAKVRGEQVSCEEVEHVLRTLAGVDDAGCVIVPDRRDGERLVAGVSSAAGRDPREILAELRRGWPDRMVPKSIVSVAAVPRSPTGKMLRERLRSVILDG